MKKAVSLLASFALAFSLLGAPVLSFADEGDVEATDQDVISDAEDVSLLADAGDGGLLEYLEGLFTDHAFTEGAAPNTGSIEVRLTTLLVDPMRTGGVKASLIKDGAVVKAADLTTKFADEDDRMDHALVAKLDDLSVGTYTLQVEGPGFMTYTQNGVQVKAGARGVVTLLDQYSDMLCAEKAHKESNESVLVDVCAGRGLMPYGDLNHDGRIDGSDAKELLQAIVRVRANPAAAENEYAKYGLNLVYAIEPAQPLSTEDGEAVGKARIAEPQADVAAVPATQAEVAAMPEIQADDAAAPSAQADDALVIQLEDQAESITNNAFDSYTEIKLVYDAAGEDPHKESALQPEFRIENATEEVDEEPPTPVASPDEDLNGSFVHGKATQPLAVGLNAFQKFATVCGARSSAGVIAHEGETSHMQVVESDDTEIKLDEGKTLTDVLFGDDGDTVQLYPKDGAPISESHPVQLTINAQGTEMNAISIAVPTDSPNAPTAGQVIIQRDDDPEELITCDFVTEKVDGRIASAIDLRTTSYASGEARLAYFDGAQTKSSMPEAVVDRTTGLITIDLKGQIPVKTITIRVTDTSSKKLAEIAQVEFLNDFQNKIPAPEMDIPSNLTVTAVGSKSITLGWTAQRNVTGYEVEISYNGSASVISTVKNGVTVKSMGGKELVNYRTYTLRARSVNGDWRSPWSPTVTATPEANGLPKKPAAPRVSGAYDSINVVWSPAEAPETPNVWYRKKGDAGFTKVANSTDLLKWTIPNLGLSTTYEVYVEGVNRKGVGPKSDVVSATTTPDKVKVPWYSLLNREVINKEKGTSFASVIEKVEGDNGSSTNNDPYAMVDGDYNTYYSGAKGGYYHGGTVTFTQPYAMDTIVLTGYQGQSLNIYDMIVQAWDENGQAIKPSGGNIKFSTLTYSSKTRTVMIRTEKLVGVKKIRVAYQRAVGSSWSASTIAELAFYNSTLYSDVMGVWADAEHTQLVADMTEEKLLELQARVNTPDVIATPDGDVSESHPSKTLLLAELDNALVVARNGGLRAPIKIDGALNTETAKRGVGGLNAWQPLGVAAAAGDEIGVYVGRKGETSGDVPLALYVVQNHPDISNGFAVRLDTTENKMKIGLNSFVIPEITSIVMEHGGSLYAAYGTGRGNNEQYTVRVSGGTEIPLLDLHNVTNTDTRMNLIRGYVNDLKTHDPEEAHTSKQHDTHKDPAYDAQNCIANATDIVLKDMMYSIPASQVAANIGVNAESTAAQVEAAAQKLSQSLFAMDEMMKLFYQHKGFVKDNTAGSKYGANNAWPTLRQNIRYVRCSGGTFMYAAGNHIGVQWGSVGGLVASPGVVFDAAGKYQSGNYFGWGVAHEIGHEINNGVYTYAEVTNNYYSQLAQATDDPTKPKTRWGTYDSIYSRVASGAKGMSLGKTGIAMYWQLHLAYDDGYNYKTYATGAEQFENLVFARMDAYARNLTAAPQAAQNGVALTLSDANKDNAIIRLACAATQKNLLDFFEAWGLTPNAKTKAYAEQWPKEERAIQYQTDALRLYRLGDFSQLTQYGVSSNNIGEAAKEARVTAGLQYEAIPNRPNTTKQQTIVVTLDGATVSNDILGYEILRNGTVVGFLRANDFEGCSGKMPNGSATFADTINTVNNRVFKYEVRAVDKLLHRGNAIEAGTVKVSHPNALSKAKWTATTNMASGATLPNETHTVTVGSGDNAIVYDAEEYAGETDKTLDHPVAKVIDNDVTSVFSGSVPEGGVGDARITIDFGETVSIVGVQVHGSSVGSSYVVEKSSDGTDWKAIPTQLAEDGTIYFTRESDAYLYGHDTGYLRLTASGQTSLAVAEIDVLGPQGDDAEFLEHGIGLLDKDETLGTTESKEVRTIPAGSLVFVGTYKGNPAYNALLLYDQNGDILGGTDKDGFLCAKEVIFAPPVADGALLGDVEEGYWAYYIEKDDLPSDWQTKITAVKAELYRVDNAHTLEGQRLVADTLMKEIPSDLSRIDLEFGQVNVPGPSEEETEGTEETGGEDLNVPEQMPAAQQLLSEPAGAPAVSGYGYDLADLYGNAVGANDGQSAAMGTPIYGGAPVYNAPVDDGTMFESRLYGDVSSTLGTPIYDNATPLASPHQENGGLARATLKSVRESLIEALKQIDVANATKSLR